MINEKFHKFITDDNGVAYELPTAEYFSHGPTITVLQVRDLAAKAANSTGRASFVLVSEFANAAWSLRPVVKRNALADVLTNNLKSLPSTRSNPLTDALALNYLRGSRR